MPPIALIAAAVAAAALLAALLAARAEKEKEKDEELAELEACPPGTILVEATGECRPVFKLKFRKKLPPLEQKGRTLRGCISRLPQGAFRRALTKQASLATNNLRVLGALQRQCDKGPPPKV